MASLLPLFSANILPILITAGAGFLLGRTTQVDPRTLSRATFYIFSPCLVFQLLTKNQLDGSAVFQIAVFAVSMTLLIGILAYLGARLLRLDRRKTAAVLITTMFTNAGNYGLSLNSFAYGEDALAFASIYFICSSAMVYTFGVFIASLGRSSIRDSLTGLFKFPTLYALLIAIPFNAFDWSLPPALNRPVEVLGGAAIPTMLVLLGLQLRKASFKSSESAMALASGLRLVAAPLLALAFSIPFGLQGAARQAGVSEAAMPTAVMATVLGTEFDVEPAFITTVVTLTTLLSPLTLTPLLAVLGA